MKNADSSQTQLPGRKNTFFKIQMGSMILEDNHLMGNSNKSPDAI